MAEVSEKSVSSVLFIFIDGLGIGPRDSHSNPLTQFEPSVLRLFSDRSDPLPRNGVTLATDATMGVPGIPQSATGQTALFTGKNASRMIGRHLQGFPNQKLRQIIADHSLFKRLKQNGSRVTFANAYSPAFFEQRPRWVSATTAMCQSSKTPLRGFDELLAGRSLYMDFTNRMLRDNGYQVPLRTPAEAGQLLARLSQDFELCLYEYFLTDWIGHRGSLEEAARLLEELDLFLKAVIEAMPLERVSLIVTSDHGNIENMRTRRHTLNPVPTMVWGELVAGFRGARKPSLFDIAPAVRGFLETACPQIEVPQSTT